MKTIKPIYEAIEREVRREVLKNLVSQLSTEIAKLEGKRRVRRLKGEGKAVQVKKGKKSLRVLTIEILKRAKKPLHVDEILKRVERSGYRSRAKSLRLLLYNMLANNKKDFRRVAKATFEVTKP